MAKNMPGTPATLESPADRWAVLTPSDTVDVADIPKAIFVTVAGDLVIRGADGVQQSFPVTVGVWPLRPTRVMLATTATVVGLYTHS